MAFTDGVGNTFFRASARERANRAPSCRGGLFLNIFRLSADGMDADFNKGPQPDDVIGAILVQADGKIVVAGRFTQFRGIPRKGLARLNRDGSLEKFFCPELEPNERKKAEIEGWILGVV